MAVTRRSAAAAAAAALALACGGTSEKTGARLVEPSAVAVVQMRTTKLVDPGTTTPSLHPYLAVANAGSAELRLFDAWDDQAVLAPVAFYPLSVSTPLPRPALVASAALPVSSGGAKPDALVVVPSGGTELQLVDTWSGFPRVVSTLPLAPLLPTGSAAAVLSIAAGPVPTSATTTATDRARFVLGLTGGRLAVVEVTRDPAGEAIAFGAAAIQAIGFDPVSLAFAPGDPVHLYAATPDPLGATADVPPRTIYGVADIDSSSASDPWPWVPLDARAPTTVVGAFDVIERDPFDLGPVDVDSEKFGTTPVRRVYAALDATGCGLDMPISCGLAVLDPATGGLRADPAGEAPFAAPIPVPGIVTAIVPAGPPANPATCPDPTTSAGGPAGCLYLAPDATTDTTAQAPARKIFVAGTDVLATLPVAAGAGQRWTPAVAAVPTNDGSAYLVDLARYGLPPERSVLRSNTRTGVTTAAVGPYDTTTGALVKNLLGLVLRQGTADAPTITDVIDALSISKAVIVTPGYTPGEAWHVEWQGKLPSLASRSARLVRSAAGLSVAFQVPNSGAPAGAPAYVSVAQVYDPRLGVRGADTSPDGVGDVVEVTVPSDVATRETAPGSGVTVCRVPVYAADGTVASWNNATTAVTFEANVASITAPAADQPGGALLLDGPGGPGAIVASATIVPGACDLASAQPDPTAAAGGLAVIATVRASQALLRGDSLGYAGRPTLGARYELRWQSEDALLPQCPLLDGQPAAACDRACRIACERLVLARKARRIFYLDDTCPKASAYDSTVGGDPCEVGPTVNGVQTPGYWPPPTANPANGAVYTFPQPLGPALAIEPLEVTQSPCEADPTTTCVVPSTGALIRGTFLAFTTQQGGSAWTARRPATTGGSVGAATPTGAAPFDRSVDPSRVNDGLRFFVSYPDNLVLDFTPGASITDVTIIR